MKTLRVVLSLVPVAGLLVGVFFVNRAEPIVLGLPFLLFWVSAWSVGTAVAMALVYVLDPRNRRRREG